MLPSLLLTWLPAIALTAPISLDESPARQHEWGYRPAAGDVSQVDPPGFCWRPQRGMVSWRIECGRGDDFEQIAYRAEGISLNVHCPPRTLGPGRYAWRYCGVDAQGRATDWSQARTFAIAEDASSMPMPPREELLARIPRLHPRLFVRPEDLPRLRQLAGGPMSGRFEDLVRASERLLKHPPSTAEPPKYPADVDRRGERWREIWWGNRERTIAALNGAATLAFTRLLGGKEEYGHEARRILLGCAKWDPRGATGYRYNDEAGMPYAYYFARSYTFLHDLLSEQERRTCRAVMKIRGEEMYRHLCPRHLWQPYSSHSNRAWHFLGEVGIAFHDEIEGADDWAWFAANVFFNVYPVWCDDDGGWHEGACYWSSYVGRFTWWADVMRSAIQIHAYDKPYFAKVGYYAMYVMPPGKVGGGFGDLCAQRTAGHNVALVSQLAAQSGNGHWQWYVEQMGGASEQPGYVGFIRGALPKTAPKPPDDLPASRRFQGTGQAALNTTLVDAADDVQVLFKSSRFGTQSHGYEANNSFLLWAYGRRLLIRSGRRDMYGSDHHRDWMWSTRSVNNVTVDGHGQARHSAASQGEIVAFKTTPSIDVVIGEAGEAYRIKDGSPTERLLLDRFTRAVVFVKPELVIVYDRLTARQDSTFEYWLHATERFEVNGQRNIGLKVDDVGCAISLLAPEGLALRQTNEYDPNPRSRVRLREWHLAAATPGKARTAQFVAIYRPHRIGGEVPSRAVLQQGDDDYLLSADLIDRGTVEVRLPKQGGGTIRVERRRADGEIVGRADVDER